jgi:3-hydroxybutyryl-CoA dehydrogenase
MAEQVTVVGAGTMGRGIAHVAAASGFDVLLQDTSPDLVERGIDGVRRDLEQGIAKGKVTPAERDTILSRIRPAGDLDAAAAGAFMVIEAVPESLDLKRQVFHRLGTAAPPGAILATNTSALSVTEIAAGVRGPERVVGMHFFNPVHLMPLVEVVRGAATSDAVVARSVEVGRAMGKEPIVVRDSPGFASSRLGVALGLEAMRMLEQGVASAEDIDRAMTLGYRHPMGPLRLTDLVGLDVRLAIAENLHRSLGSETFRPPEILCRKVRDGKLGRKSGEGFFRWDQA